MRKILWLIQGLLLLTLAIFTVLFFGFLNLYGAFLGLVTLAIAILVYCRFRWGYFAAAGWGLACYQLAKQGYEFAAYKSPVMLVGVLVVVAAIVLHETLGKKYLPGGGGKSPDVD